jgi:hypothetical protein
MDEGEDIGQVSGSLTPEALDEINKHQLIDGKEYTCQICGKKRVAPFVYRCICGLRVCESCSSDHENW